MKKFFKLVILTTIILTCILIFTSCSEKTVNVENVVSFDDQFKGSRTITLNVGSLFNEKSEAKTQLDDVITHYCPSVFEHSIQENQDETKYVFTLNFASAKDYENKIGIVLGRSADVNFSTPDSKLAKGWRYVEDFDGMELLNFLTVGATEKKYNDLLVNLVSLSNIVNYKNEVQSSDKSVINVNNLKGYAVTDIAIETTNNKKDSYDRRFTITFPQSTYEKMGQDLLNLMKQRTDEIADYSGWTQQGNHQEYQIFYKGVNLSQLQAVTSKFLECDNEHIYYGDENNSSTPLAEQLVFEENLNTLSFMGDKSKKVPLSYKYSLPIKTTYGEGLVLKDGVWTKDGKWIDGVYTLNSQENCFNIRVPDGMQYKIDGVSILVENKGNSKFTRDFSLLYDKNSGVEGCQYATNYFNKKGIKTTTTHNETNLICRISKSGSTTEINDFYKKLFGSSNSFTKTENTSAMAVVTDLNLVDEVNISNILNHENTDIAFNYTLKNTGNENILSATSEKDNKTVNGELNKNNEYVFKLTGGENTIKIYSTVAYQDGIITYCIIASIMLLITAGIITLLILKDKKSKQNATSGEFIEVTAHDYLTSKAQENDETEE